MKMENEIIIRDLVSASASDSASDLTPKNDWTDRYGAKKDWTDAGRPLAVPSLSVATASGCPLLFLAFPGLSLILILGGR